MDVKWIYFDDHFAKYTNFDSLYCTLKLKHCYVNHITIKKKGGSTVAPHPLICGFGC